MSVHVNVGGALRIKAERFTDGWQTTGYICHFAPTLYGLRMMLRRMHGRRR